MHVSNKIKDINECINSAPVAGGYNKAMMCHQIGTGVEDTL